MKKFFVLITLFLTLFSITLTTGCGGGGSSSSDEPVTYPEDSDVNIPPSATTSTKRISQIVFSGDRVKTETFAYNANGFITGIANTTDTDYYMTFKFDASGNPTEIVSADGSFIPDGSSTAVDDLKSLSFTYQDGKVKTQTETSIEEDGSDRETLITWNAWTGYTPTSGTYVEGTFNMTLAATINGEGQIATFSGTSSGVSIFRETMTYTATGYTETDEDYDSDTEKWIITDKTVITVDSENKITGRKLTEYNDDRTYEIKESTYTYNTGYVDTITFVRTNYTAAGVVTGSIQNYTAAVSYITGTSRPACNDILQDDRYALEYLD